MRGFVYEYFTAHGIGRDPASPEHGIYREGRAMRDTLVADLGRVAGVQGFALADGVVMGEFSGFRDIVKMSHWTVVIAPETGGILAEQVRVITRYHGRPLGP